MGRLERAAAVAGIVLVATACSGDDDDPGLGAIETPTFAEDDASGSTTTTPERVVGTPSTVVEGSTTTVAADRDPGTTTTTTADVRTESVSFDDPVGDATPGVGTGTPPAWTDLAGASLDRRGNAYRLAIRLGGDRAPARSDGTSTMNIASFYDVDGDGSIDFEIWANLGPEGWGAAWYDEEERAAFGEDSNVTVLVEDNEVVLLFPDVMLGTPDRFRFSLASEYGELSTIGSSFARRDDAPDGDRAVAFPG
jgi:hypothetical protein